MLSASSSKVVADKGSVTGSEQGEWDLLLALYQGGQDPDRCSDTAAYKSAVRRVFAAVDLIHLILNEVMRSLPLQQLAFKIVLDIGCMRSVAGVKWANQVLQRWRDEGRWYQVQKECDEIWGRPGFAQQVSHFNGWELRRQACRRQFQCCRRPLPSSILEVRLYSGGAIIDCEHNAVSSRKLGVRNFGAGRESGHYTLSIDECDVGGVQLPADFVMPSTVDIMILSDAVLPERQVAILDHAENGLLCPAGVQPKLNQTM